MSENSTTARGRMSESRADTIIVGDQFDDFVKMEERVYILLEHIHSEARGLSIGADIHTELAARFLGVTPDEVTPEQRQAAKWVNTWYAFDRQRGLIPTGTAAGRGLKI